VIDRVLALHLAKQSGHSIASLNGIQYSSSNQKKVLPLDTGTLVRVWRGSGGGEDSGDEEGVEERERARSSSWHLLAW
jgi:hypothetical protein